MNRLLLVEKKNLIKASIALLITSGLGLSAPAVLAYAIDTYLMVGDYEGVMRCGGLLLSIAAVACTC